MLRFSLVENNVSEMTWSLSVSIYATLWTVERLYIFGGSREIVCTLVFGVV